MCVPIARGFVYLPAAVESASCCVLAHRVAVTAEAEHAIAVLKEVFAKYGEPDTANADQGSQFTREAFTDTVRGKGLPLSVDGKGCWRDSLLVERLWRSVKYEAIYLKAFESIVQADHMPNEALAAIKTAARRPAAAPLSRMKNAERPG